MKNDELSKRVKELRNRKGISQEVLAEKTGLSLRTIQRIENGETEPRGDSLKRLANALNINPEELIDWAIIEDHGFLKAMNLSALTFILFPVLGILVPLIIWISKKDKIKGINETAKKIINFEITWTIILFAGFILNSVYATTIFNMDNKISVESIVSWQRISIFFFLMMYILNASLIIINTYRIGNSKEMFYQPKINFVRN